jgi:hypothetical protein
MAGASITGSVGGMAVAVNTSTGIQRGLAAQILNSAGSTNPVAFATASGPLTNKTAIVSGANSLVSGATSVPSATVLLNGQFDTYINNGTAVSTVVAADNSNSTIINANPQGALVAATGAGANVLAGFFKANEFVTGDNGQDIAYLNGAKNTLTSNGSDGVMVGGPSTITAAFGGLDNIVMTTGTTLSFINGSAPSAVDSVTGAANATIAVAGTGNTSITAGTGPESFFVDTASGNVTLGANLHATDMFTFTANGSAGTNQTTVVNFASGDGVLLHGYTGYSLSPIMGSGSGSVLSLSDGSKVTFSDASTASITAAIKVS